MSRTRLHHIAGTAALTALVACFFLPLALDRSLWLRDIARFTYPMKFYLRERLLRGELPLWNPRLGLGRPFLGMVQPGVLYPLNVILLLPVPRGADLFFAFHSLVAALGMRRWLRALGSAEIEGALGGALFALSGYFVSVQVGNGCHIVGAAWIPWALAGIAGLGETGVGAASHRATRRAIVVVGASLSLMLLGGDPQAAWFSVPLLFAQALAPANRRGVSRGLVVIVGGGVLALALSMMQLLPAREVAAMGRPGGVSVEDAAHFAFAPARLVEFIWPAAFGTPYSPRWLLHALYDEGTGASYEPFAAGVYLGVAALPLCMGALLWSRRRPIDVWLGGLAALSLLVALGTHAPFWLPLFEHVPGASLFRYPEKYLLVTTLCVVPLSVRGVESAVACPRRSLALGGAFLLLLALGWLWAARAGGAWISSMVGRMGGVTPEQAGSILAERARDALCIGAAIYAPLALYSMGRLSERGARLALSACVIADLFFASARLIDFTPSEIYRVVPPPITSARAREPESLVRIYRPLHLIFDAPDADPAVLLRGTLMPNAGVDMGIAHLDAYDNFPLPGEQALWSALRGQPLRLMQLTGTHFLLISERSFVPRPGLQLVGRYPEFHGALAEVTVPAPRVYLATDVRPDEGDDAAARTLAAPDFAPGRSAVIVGATASTASGDCRLRADRIEHLVIDCQSDAGGWMVLSDAFFPGWQAIVEGRRTPIARANLAMRAVPVPAGRSVVELHYRPAHLAAGAFVSAAALLVAVALAIF